VSAAALDQLLDLQLLDAAQHAHSLSMLPTHQEAWAAPDSLPATLAWTVLRSGALSEDDLKALAGRTSHPDIVADAIALVDGAKTVTRKTSTSTTFSLDSLDFTTSSSSSTSSLPTVSFTLPPSSSSSTSQTRTFTWTSSTSAAAPSRWKKVAGIVVIVLIALYVLFGRWRDGGVVQRRPAPPTPLIAARLARRTELRPRPHSASACCWPASRPRGRAAAGRAPCR
jgi:hypothetical protein